MLRAKYQLLSCPLSCFAAGQASPVLASSHPTLLLAHHVPAPVASSSSVVSSFFLPGVFVFSFPCARNPLPWLCSVGVPWPAHPTCLSLSRPVSLLVIIPFPAPHRPSINHPLIFSCLCDLYMFYCPSALEDLFKQLSVWH